MSAISPTHYEDFVVGDRYELGSVTVDEAEVIGFATRYDPQPFHVDPEAAKLSPFGGLIASGWQTCAMYMRLLVDGLSDDAQSQGSPGVEEVRWLAPVRPGDTLTASATVLEVSATKPHRGTIIMECEFVNQDGVQVWRMRSRMLFGRRPVADGTIQS